MKTIRKIKTLGLSDSSMTRLTAYCALLSSELIEQWMVVNSGDEADLLIMDVSFLEHQPHFSYDPNVTIICSKDGVKSEAFPHVLEYPLNSKKLKSVLNQISQLGKFKIGSDVQTPRVDGDYKPELDKQDNVKSFADRLKEKLKYANETKNTLFTDQEMSSKVLMH